MNAEHLTDCASRRAHRTAAARWLAGQAFRKAVEWHDLAALPAWVCADAARLDAWALHAGAWLHADRLRRCIDGRTLEALCVDLGAPAFAALLADEPAAEVPALPASWPAWLRDEGRACLLASIASGRLRAGVQLALWPGLSPVTPGTWPAGTAAAIVAQAAVFLTAPVGARPEARP